MGMLRETILRGIPSWGKGSLLTNRSTTPPKRGIPYEIASPCARPVDEQSVPLFEDGGAQRPASMRKRGRIKTGSRIMGLSGSVPSGINTIGKAREDVWQSARKAAAHFFNLAPLMPSESRSSGVLSGSGSIGFSPSRPWLTAIKLRPNKGPILSRSA